MNKQSDDNDVSTGGREGELQVRLSEIKDAIRQFCSSLSSVAVQMSHGVERIYYSGISLDALATAVALRLAAAPRQAEAVAGRLEIEGLARALEVQLHSHSPIYLTSVTTREIIAALRASPSPDIAVKALKEIEKLGETAHISNELAIRMGNIAHAARLSLTRSEQL